ncbi:MAG: 3'-5' exonuclease domain-containing protein 2 [Prolixibacteraceae bacterium]|jgi:ribonuclease D|nr:3'-5' exonuclease domain-containing protein 2 [Prolixibacteraceae bacterium]
MTYKESITKEELQELPLQQFDGEIIVINKESDAKKAVDYLSKFPFLGFDTETKPAFKKGQINYVALLQLSTNNKTFLFRVNFFELPKSLLKLLSDKSIIKAGAAIRDDIKALQVNKKFNPDGFFELQDEAQDLGLTNFSLKKMAGIMLGIKISKAQQLSNWEAPELTEAQLRYAATDAWISYRIYESFLTMREQMNS